MCRCSGAKNPELDQVVARLTAENGRLTRELETAIDTRNRAQERASALAIENQRLRGLLAEADQEGQFMRSRFVGVTK